MKVRIASLFAITATVALLLPILAHAEPKKKAYNNSADEVFNAALRTARERHVVTYVDEKALMFTFETGRSLTSEGFVANASVEPNGDDNATLIINVQTKKGFSWGAGDRMADKFYQQVGDELAGEPRQKSAVKATEKAVAVPDAKAVPPEPSMTATPSLTTVSAVLPPAKGSVTVSSVPDGADIYVDESFVGNAPATLKLTPGKHTVKVQQDGYKPWTKDVSVFADSEANLKASLSKNN
jgi:PEGA domain